MKVSTIVLKRVEFQSAVANIYVQTVGKFCRRTLPSKFGPQSNTVWDKSGPMLRRRVIACCTLRHLFLTPQKSTPHHNITLIANMHTSTRLCPGGCPRAHRFDQICFSGGEEINHSPVHIADYRVISLESASVVMIVGF